MRLLKLLISLLLAGADALISAVRRLTGRRPASLCVVLYYHSISAGSRRRFAAQMDQLIRLTEPVDIEVDAKLGSGRRQSAVTFDDGFVSVVENALPELRARGIPCTIFVPTGSLDSHPGWIDPSHPDAGEVVVSLKLLRTIAADPLVGIGSHSVSHPDLRRLDEAQVRDELRRSKSVLEKIRGRPVRSFSFPYGVYTPRNLELARECGYTRVFTIEPKQLRDARNEFIMGRVRVDPSDWSIEFRLKAIGAYRWMVHASALKRCLLGLVRGPGIFLLCYPQALLEHAGLGL